MEFLILDFEGHSNNMHADAWLVFSGTIVPPATTTPSAKSSRNFVSTYSIFLRYGFAHDK